MPAFISLQDAAHHYSLSESTLHKWLNKHWLTSHKVLVHGHSHYLIEVEELEKLLSERGMTRRTSTSQDTLDLTTRLEALGQRVSELEALVHSLQIHSLPSTPQPLPRVLQRPQTADPLPDGSVFVYQFLHGINRTTAMRWLNDQQLIQHSDQGSHVAKNTLSREGQVAYYRYAKNRPEFVRCPECPHELRTSQP